MLVLKILVMCLAPNKNNHSVFNKHGWCFLEGAMPCLLHVSLGNPPLRLVCDGVHIVEPLVGVGIGDSCNVSGTKQEQSFNAQL